MRRSLLLACVLTSLTMFASPRAAHADDAAVKEAQARFDEGVALADAGKNEEARLKFTQAVAVLKAPSVLFNLARVEQLTGHELEALDHYKQFLRAAQNDPKVTDALREKTRGYIADLSKKAGQIDLDAPPETRVSVDGKPVDDRNPADPLHVTPGRHTLEGSYQGRVKSVVVECPAGLVTKAKLDFDGPVTDPPPGGEDKASSTKWVVAGALGVAGLAGLGMGIGFGLSSQTSKDESEDLRRANPGLCSPPGGTNCDAYDGKRSDAETAATVSTIGYVAGGVLLAGSIATMALWPSRSERSAVRRPTRPILAPSVGSGTAGLSLMGNF